MSKVVDLHKKWSRDADYRKDFDELKSEFALAASPRDSRGQVATGRIRW